MKSDREFLDGIYEKVDRYQKENKRNNGNKEFRIKPSMLTSIALVTSIAIILVGVIKINNKPVQNIDKGNMIRNVFPTEDTPNPISSYHLDPIGIPEIILSGIVDEINQEDKTITLDEIKAFQGNVSLDGELIFHYNDYEIDKNFILKGTKLLVFLSDLDSQYVLMNENIYILIENNKEYEVYEDMYGDRIDTRDLYLE